MTGRILVVVVLALVACNGDDDATPPPTTAAPAVTTTSRAAEPGDVDVPARDGTVAVPVPSLGFGIAVPEGWQVTLLSDDALARLEAADLAEPFFLESARNVAATGAVLYGAGIDPHRRVAELKVDVQEDTDTDTAAVESLAETVAASGALGEEASVRVGADGLVRIVYRIEQTSADDGTPIETVGSQLFVPDERDDRLWSLIVTAEDPDTLAALLDLFENTFVLD